MMGMEHALCHVAMPRSRLESDLQPGPCSLDQMALDGRCSQYHALVARTQYDGTGTSTVPCAMTRIHLVSDLKQGHQINRRVH